MSLKDCKKEANEEPVTKNFEQQKEGGEPRRAFKKQGVWHGQEKNKGGKECRESDNI